MDPLYVLEVVLARETNVWRMRQACIGVDRDVADRRTCAYEAAEEGEPCDARSRGDGQVAEAADQIAANR